MLPNTATTCNNAQYSANDIYHCHSDFIRKAIKFHVADPLIAEDVFQDFYLHLIKYPPPHDLKSVEAFLFRAITNLIRNSNLEQKVYEKHLRKYGEEVQPVRSDKPEQRLIRVEETAKILEVIQNNLNRREAAAITARYLHGSELEEVAQTLNVNTRSVGHYICTGLGKVRKIANIKGVLSW